MDATKGFFIGWCCGMCSMAAIVLFSRSEIAYGLIATIGAAVCAVIDARSGLQVKEG